MKKFISILTVLVLLVASTTCAFAKPAENHLKVSVAHLITGEQVGGKVTLNDGTESASIDETIVDGSSYTLKAKADEGYVFRSWAAVDGDGNEMAVSYSSPYDVEFDWLDLVDNAYTIKAKFADNAEAMTMAGLNYYVNGQPAAGGFDDPVGGKVSVDGGAAADYCSKSLKAGQSATFKAIPDEGYKFLGWMDANSGEEDFVSTEAEYTVSYPGTDGIVLYAVFLYEDWDDAANVLIKTNKKGVGDISIDGDSGYTKFESSLFGPKTYELVANEDYGYEFDAWYDGDGNLLSEDAEYTLEVTEGKDYVVVAHYDKITDEGEDVDDTDDNNSPKTGDENSPLLWLAIMALAGSGLYTFKKNH
ncbi:MAG: InlB B-repeat-containing protein [Clostridia bacterium]|nr:InlB B-repeat-containing protein [Clostridia bacterium]